MDKDIKLLNKVISFKYRELNKIFLEKVTEVDFDKEVDTSNFDLQKFI